MKKLIVLMIAAVLAVAACAAAFANDTAAGLYNSAAKLLFEENKLTLNATAEFSLGGTWFKTAEVVLKEDGDRAFRKLHLRSPKADGTERENGYTIVTEGNNLYLMDEFTPGIYRTGTIADQRSSVVRSTMATKQLIELGRVLASQADLLLGKDAVTKTADGEFRIVLGENAPAIVNVLLNQGFQFAGKRYFGMDYDWIGTNRTYMSLYDYGTLTQGILFSARGISLQQAEITVKTGESGYPMHTEGSIGLYLETAENGVKQLEIKFSADVTDIGSTALKKFNPDDYNVVIAEDSAQPYNPEYQPANDEALKDQMMMEAMRIWENTGFNMVATTSVTCNWNDYYYEVAFEGGDDGLKKVACFDETGKFVFIRAEPADWLHNLTEDDEYNLEGKPDRETDNKVKAFFMQFLENIKFERIDQVKDLQVQWTFEKNGSLYAMYEDKSDPEGEGVYFVIRISPEMRIENFGGMARG